MRHTGATWLCPEPVDRQRVLDNMGRVRRARMIAGAAIGFALVLYAPRYGWWTLLLFALAAVNNPALDRRCAELADQARLTGDPVSVLMCDIDRFKRINDEHGHSRGDAVLREIGYELRRHLRSFELIYRLGGEEFLVVFPGADEAIAATLGEQLRTAVEDARPGGVDITLSIGLATARGEDVGFEHLFEAADAARYDAKAAGR